MTNHITVTTTTEVSDQDCYDVLTTALEGGYMEEFAVLDRTRAEDLSVTRMLLGPADGYEVGLEGFDEAVEVDEAKVREGLQKFAEWVAANDPEHRSYLGQQFAEGLRDGWGYLDAIGADAVLQFAVFGEVIFG